jgi:hypothetical protein
LGRYRLESAWHGSWHECFLRSPRGTPDTPQARLHLRTPQRVVPRHGLGRDRPRQLRESHATYQDAEKALTRLQSQGDEDRHPKSEITVRRAIEQWLEVVDLEDSTRERTTT